MDLAKLGVLILAAYLVGALPNGLVIGFIHGKDLRQYGSGKTGATNVSRVIGRRAALLVFVLDALKGALPVLLARLIGWNDPNTEAIAIGCTACAALIGHIWSIWIRIFTGAWGGGRGVATGIGTMLVVNPWVALVGLGIGIPVIIITRYVSLGSIVGIGAGSLLMVVLVVLQHLSPWLAIYAVVAGGLVVVIHHDNIERLRNGTERKLTFGGPR
ncbi:MAG TPA: glycerol-3-phosphate 1-O-acyltransferase PlsY [Chloroflexia bacterium]|nr:glycerol-3-phosphate 1-O-acyltransferase PlsY [Chloroflexia bacterium]